MSIMPIQPSYWSSAVNPTGSFRRVNNPLCHKPIDSLERVTNHAAEQHRQLQSVTNTRVRFYSFAL
jgi:hypothetical protein